MPIPDYQTVMLPLLRLVAGTGELPLRDAIERIADEFALTGEERAQLLPSGAARTIASRVGWARTYLKQAGLVAAPRRGVIEITAAGRALLARRPDRIDLALLEEYADFRAFRERSRDGGEEPELGTTRQVTHAASRLTPEDRMADAHVEIRARLETDLLEMVKRASPAFFERLVVDLMLAMGYGGSRVDAGRAVGRSGDGGIDGIIKEDRLGLDLIYLQAKRWEGTVGRPELHRFAGALQERRASRGVFVTTSSFTNEARDFVRLIGNGIVLVDGAELARLMVDHDVGVSHVGTYVLKRVDSDYFDGE
jgi:restriction system protein